MQVQILPCSTLTYETKRAKRPQTLDFMADPRDSDYHGNVEQPESEASFAASDGSAATSELSAIINAARERGCAEHGHEIKWLLELPMTDDEWKRLNELTGWPSRKQQNEKGQR